MIYHVIMGENKYEYDINMDIDPCLDVIVEIIKFMIIMIIVGGHTYLFSNIV